MKVLSALEKVQVRYALHNDPLSKLFRLGCGMVVFGDSYGTTDPVADDLMFQAYHVVTDQTDFWLDAPKMPSSTNYWLAKEGETGNEAALYMYFNCPQIVSGFFLKNTNNANLTNDSNYGTKDFTIWIADSPNNPQWRQLLSGTLPDGANVDPIPTLSFRIKPHHISLQYIKLTVDTFYGQGGGLQYFATFL